MPHQKKLAGMATDSQDKETEPKEFTYQNLRVWQKSVETYGVIKDLVETAEGVAEEELATEMRRTALFVPCSLASGYEYRFVSRKTSALMLRQVANSVVRLEVHLRVATELGLLDQAEALETLRTDLLGIRKMTLSLAAKIMQSAYRRVAESSADDGDQAD